MKPSRHNIDGVEYVRAHAIVQEGALLRSLARTRSMDPTTASALLAAADRLDEGAGGERPAPVGWDEFVGEFIRPRLLAGQPFAGVVLTPEDCTGPHGFGGWKVRVQREPTGVAPPGASITDYFHKCSGMDWDEVMAQAARWYIDVLTAEQHDQERDPLG